MSIGPWFKCYPDRFVRGMDALSLEEQAFYTQLVMRMYDAGDAIYADDKTIAKWCNSNTRRWLRVKEGLIAKERIIELPDGGLIDERALEEMAEFCGRKKTKVSGRVRERIAKLTACLGNVLQIVSQTSPETPMFSTSTIDIEIERKGKISADGAAALEGLRAACGEGKLGEYGKLLACVCGWHDGVIFVTGRWARDNFSESLRGPLAANGLSLAVQSEALPQATSPNSQPKLKTIDGGKA